MGTAPPLALTGHTTARGGGLEEGTAGASAAAHTHGGRHPLSWVLALLFGPHAVWLFEQTSLQMQCHCILVMPPHCDPPHTAQPILPCIDIGLKSDLLSNTCCKNKQKKTFFCSTMEPVPKNFPRKQAGMHPTVGKTAHNLWPEITTVIRLACKG